MLPSMSLVAYKYQKQVYALLLLVILLQSFSLAHEAEAHLFDAPLVAESCECELATFKHLFSDSIANNTDDNVIVVQFLLATSLTVGVLLKTGFLSHLVRGPPNSL